jgi:RNA polymerase primary sigma factor
MSQTAVKKMIAEARARGYITYDQLNRCCRPIRSAPNRSRT